MIYGIVRLVLDDFSALHTRWMPDLDSIVLFKSKAVRDDVLEGLEAGCESYEDYAPLDLEFWAAKRKREKVECPPRDERGRFLKYIHNEDEKRKSKVGEG